MNRVQFGEGACEKTRRYMDSYISNELLVETTHDVLRHLDSCPACSSELETRTRLRSRLKSAVQSQAVPLELTSRVREQIRNHKSPAWFQGRGFGTGWFATGWFTTGWNQAAMAAATVVLVIFAGIMRQSSTPVPDITDRVAQTGYIQKISAAVGQVFKSGLGDHIHCAIFRRYPPNPPAIQEMEANLGAAYKGLLPLVAPAVPAGYRIVMGHQCSYAGRHFVHLTMRKDNDLISLVIARKNDGETFSGLSPAMGASGVPVYRSSSENYQVAGFESDHYLAFVVSDLKGKTNLQIAAALAPSVRRLLS